MEDLVAPRNLSCEEFVDRSLIPSAIIRFPSDEKLWLVVARGPKLIFFPIILEIPDSERVPLLRSRLVAVFPEDLCVLTADPCLASKAWIDCNEPNREYSLTEVEAALVREPWRFQGNFREGVMSRVKKLCPNEHFFPI